MTNSVKDETILKSIQTTLGNLSLYKGRIDGLFGKTSRDGFEIMLKEVYPSFNYLSLPGNTYEAKSVFSYLQSALAGVGLYTHTVDGIWGSGSQTGFDKLTEAYRQATKKPNGESTLPLGFATVRYDYLTEEQFKNILPKENWDKVPIHLEPLNKSMELFDINTPLRKAHYLAQILHETAYFKYSEEIASGKLYEGRVDLGNIKPGDGILFKGRGDLQITGRSNYVACESFLRKHLNIPDFDITSTVTAASQLSNNPLYAALASGYFWKFIKPKLNETADKDDVYWVSVYVNGYAKQSKPYYPKRDKEPNGMADRVKMLTITKKVFGLV